ncbi:hypothetical protein DP067_00095 [Mycoplasmopsis anatis]|uniref:Uncharacterized protein n=2 Tax=Mycoplasmopsis anatis TaxID=171279 RepID=F9QCN2_9BACT|nr:hypothetical protein DP067_00095 [Mycoplasmopsis anatis]EGS29499.1 hypothetical protein GIG_00942 [Mycoplasmopsis anatis 1340]VEU73801.1 Uncharacterised protein [Mycoplasmopsis anatis]
MYLYLNSFYGLLITSVITALLIIIILSCALIPYSKTINLNKKLQYKKIFFKYEFRTDYLKPIIISYAVFAVLFLSIIVTIFISGDIYWKHSHFLVNVWLCLIVLFLSNIAFFILDKKYKKLIKNIKITEFKLSKKMLLKQNVFGNFNNTNLIYANTMGRKYRLKDLSIITKIWKIFAKKYLALKIFRILVFYTPECMNLHKYVDTKNHQEVYTMYLNIAFKQWSYLTKSNDSALFIDQIAKLKHLITVE